ncbi:MAG: CPBP family intramembrane metalloprotease [SAR324 cluster bacterium]|nr:CPBP family intramembrane metalloprotease [SAR324 cluster bacterium]
MQSYFQESHNAYYSIVAALPLLISYEILLMITRNPYWQVRNAADVWLREVLFLFDLTSQQATFAMIAILFILIPFVHPKYSPLKWRYFGYIILESTIYSLFFGAIIHSILHAVFLASPVQDTFLQNVALSLGAGLYEEFFFRVLLLNVLFWGLKFFLKNTTITGLISIFLAAFLFSLSHYVGALSDHFDFYSFLFRMTAGLVFTVIYFLRGFAVAAYTHALYDIWVFL